ncbi:unnamed protein product [Lactuca saligna]|uniref:Uncharacterized protein n=1 Tax=Lactuca saligna TaxID=75948 RepID=A0AA35VL95_LACSI|nr:unnamed protein product [Lactuca saligna]
MKKSKLTGKGSNQSLDSTCRREPHNEGSYFFCSCKFVTTSNGEANRQNKVLTEQWWLKEVKIKNYVLKGKEENEIFCSWMFYVYASGVLAEEVEKMDATYSDVLTTKILDIEQ